MNCSPELDWAIKADHLSDLCFSMMISGYDEHYRRQIINGVITRYRQIQFEVEAATRRWYRDRSTIQNDKKQKGGNNAASWHLRGDTRQTLQVPITPGSSLAKNMKKQIKDIVGPDKGKTMTIEMGGLPVTAGIMKSDPFRPQHCRFDDQNCLVGSDQDCMDQNVVYRIACQEPVRTEETSTMDRQAEVSMLEPKNIDKD